jgi:type I restriction enzyme S subunit
MSNSTEIPTGWSHHPLGDLIEEIASGVSVNAEDRRCTNGEVGVLKTSCVYSGIFRSTEHKAVVRPQEVKRVRTPVQADRIIVSRMNTPDLVGASGYSEEPYPSLFLPDRLWQLQTKPSADACWLSYVLGSPHYRGFLKKIATGTSQSMKNISQEAFLRIPILTPPVAEQRRIAYIFRIWDHALGVSERLIAAKLKQRNYLHTRLINLSRWPKCPIGSLISAVSRPTAVPETAYTALGIRSHGRGTFQRVVERPSEIDMDTVFIVGDRDLIINITFGWEGAIALAKPEDAGCLVSHRFPTFDVNDVKIDREYLGYAVTTRRFFNELRIASPGGAGRNRVLNKADFLRIEIPLPPQRAQKTIAELLSAADRELLLLERQRTALERQKRGLMTRLFTGEWRVPIRADEPHNMNVRVLEETAQ